MPDICIVCKGILLVHELTVCAEQDFPYLLIDGCIVCKDTSLLHELTFRVDEDVLCQMLDIHNAYKHI